MTQLKPKHPTSTLKLKPTLKFKTQTQTLKPKLKIKTQHSKLKLKRKFKNSKTQIQNSKTQNSKPKPNTQHHSSKLKLKTQKSHEIIAGFLSMVHFPYVHKHLEEFSTRRESTRLDLKQLH